jgi:hypothetical protein
MQAREERLGTYLSTKKNIHHILGCVQGISMKFWKGLKSLVGVVELLN